MTPRRANSSPLRVYQAVGLLIVGGALWLGLFENVDTDAANGPTNCGPNSLRVLVNGPSRNTDVLTASDCRTAALINIAMWGLALVIGVAIACGAPDWIGRRTNRRLSTRLGSTTIGLQRFTLNWRPPSLETACDEVHLVLPRYFGRQPWTIPTEQIVVADLVSAALAEPADKPAGDGAHELFFERPPSIPYLYTASALGAPNLALLFRQPQRVLPLRRFAAWDKNLELPFTRRDSMSPAGAHLDGVMLKAHNVSGAVATLRRAGVEMTTDPDRWLAAHHATIDDPGAIADAKTEAKRAKWINRVGFGVPAALFAAGLVADVLGGETAIPFLLGASWLGFAAFQIHLRIVGRRAIRPVTSHL